MARGRRGGSDVEYPEGVGEIPASLSANELCRRLKLLKAALCEMEQSGEEAVRRWAPLAAHLTQPAFVGHQNREVRVLVACAIADLLRVSAGSESPLFPDPLHLKEVCVFLVRQLRGLDTPKDPLHKHFHYLLENLAKVKSLLVSQELESAADASEVLVELLRHVLAAVTDQHDGRELDLMEELIVPVLQGADHVSWEILDALLLHLVPPLKLSHPKAAELAGRVVRKCEKELDQPLTSFITHALASSERLEDVELGKHVLPLVGELYPLVPDLFLSVIPQLEYRFLSEQEKQRLEMVALMGPLLAETPLGTENPTLFQAFLGRLSRDMKPSVRKACVENCASICARQPNLRKELCDALEHRSRDTEDEIRVLVVKTIFSLAKRSLHLVTPGLLKAVSGRTADKKVEVRREALLCLATLYRKYALKMGPPGATQGSQDEPEDALTPDEAADLTRPFKDDILRGVYQEKVDEELCKKIFSSCLVPFMLDTRKRMRTLVELYAGLGGSLGRRSPLKALDGIFRQQCQSRIILRDMLDLHFKEENFPDREARIQNSLKQLAQFFCEPKAMLAQLQDFYKALCQEPDLLNTLTHILGTDYTAKEIDVETKEMVRLASMLPCPGLQNTTRRVMEHTAPLHVDRAAAEALVELVGGVVGGEPDAELSLSVDEEQAKQRSLLLLRTIGECFPYCFESRAAVEGLLELQRSDEPGAAFSATSVLRCMASEAVRHGRSERLLDLRPAVLKAQEALVLATTSGKAARKAVSILKLFSSAPDQRDSVLLVYRRLLEKLEPRLEMGREGLVPALNAIGAMAEEEPRELADSLKAIISTKLVKPIILHASTEPADYGEEQWVARERLSVECEAKMAAVKLIVRWLMKWNSAEEGYADRTVRMLRTMLETNGDFEQGGEVPLPEKAHLRLVAGTQLLKMAALHAYRHLFSVELKRMMAQLVCDDVFMVTRTFAKKISLRMRTHMLPLEWMGLLGMAALFQRDPGAPAAQVEACTAFLKTEVPNFLASTVSQRLVLRQQSSNKAYLGWQVSNTPLALPPLLHHLAWQPRLCSHDDVDGLRELRDALWLVTKAVLQFGDHREAQAGNVETVYRLFQAVKDCVDATAPDDLDQNRKLWALCDVGMMLVLHRSPSTAFSTNAKRLDMHKAYPTFFLNHPDPEVRKHSNLEIFVPKELVEEEKRLVASHRTQGLQKPRVHGADQSSRARSKNASGLAAARSAKPKAAKRPNASTIREDDDEDDDDDLQPLASSKSPAKAKSPRMVFNPKVASTPAQQRRSLPKTASPDKSLRRAGKAAPTKASTKASPTKAPSKPSTPKAGPSPAARKAAQTPPRSERASPGKRKAAGASAASSTASRRASPAKPQAPSTPKTHAKSSKAPPVASKRAKKEPSPTPPPKKAKPQRRSASSSSARKSPAARVPDKSPASKAPAKSPAAKAPAKSPAAKAPAKSPAAKAKGPAAKKSPAKKAAAKKSPSKKASPPPPEPSRRSTRQRK